ncbi:MAG: signal recognition particle-docking protein FtsY, partial [Oscillospiraceae bacterium]|nr:signal recognition particle-docking protein FtsY [Oscillospiraceae bacterium]
MGLFSKIKMGLQKTKSSMMNAVEDMLGAFTKIDDDLFDELEEILIMSDVGVQTSSKICDLLREEVKSQRVTDPSKIKGMLKEIVSGMLAGGEELRISTKPSVILVIGVNGVGKTTTIGKLAALLKSQGKKVLLGAADTFRAAAIDQLEIWSERAGAELIKHSEGADPAAVVFDALAAGKARGSDVIICDTAGRLHNKKNLM